MIEPVQSVARKLLRDSKTHRLTTRFWAGWRLELTYGPMDQAFGPERHAAAMNAARAIYEQLGVDVPEDDPQAMVAAREASRDLFHLSASWRGNHPAEEGKRLLAELIVALGVPVNMGAGIQPARTFTGSTPNAQVTHWEWHDRQR